MTNYGCRTKRVRRLVRPVLGTGRRTGAELPPGDRLEHVGEAGRLGHGDDGFRARGVHGIHLQQGGRPRDEEDDAEPKMDAPKKDAAKMEVPKKDEPKKE